MNIKDIEAIHIIWEGPLTVSEAVKKTTADDYGVYQIYGTHETSGPDTLLYIGQADQGTFSGRISAHSEEWGRWNAQEITIYLGRIAGTGSVTDTAWGLLIDEAEAVLIWKIGVPYNSARIKSLKYNSSPIIVINHAHRHRLPECISTITEFLNSETSLKIFGPSGYPAAPPTPVPGQPAETTG